SLRTLYCRPSAPTRLYTLSLHDALPIYIGTTKIVAIVGRRNAHGKIEVLGVGTAKSLGVHKGIVNNISQTIQSIKSAVAQAQSRDRKSTRLNSSHVSISYAVFCLKKKKE